MTERAPHADHDTSPDTPVHPTATPRQVRAIATIGEVEAALPATSSRRKRSPVAPVPSLSRHRPRWSGRGPSRSAATERTSSATTTSTTSATRAHVRTFPSSNNWRSASGYRCLRRAPSDVTAFWVAGFEVNQWLLWRKPDSTWVWKLTDTGDGTIRTRAATGHHATVAVGASRHAGWQAVAAVGRSGMFGGEAGDGTSPRAPLGASRRGGESPARTATACCLVGLGPGVAWLAWISWSSGRPSDTVHVMWFVTVAIACFLAGIMAPRGSLHFTVLAVVGVLATMTTLYLWWSSSDSTGLFIGRDRACRAAGRDGCAIAALPRRLAAPGAAGRRTLKVPVAVGRGSRRVCAG